MQNFMVYVDYRKLFIHLRSLKVHHFGMVGGDRKYGVKVILNGMTSLLNFMKNYNMVIKGTHRQNGDLTRLLSVLGKVC
jgi:hypothetical protein